MSNFDFVYAIAILFAWGIGLACGLMLKASAEIKKQPRFAVLRKDTLKNMGDCDTCGEWSGSLVEGQCAVCRKRIPA